MFAVMFAVVVVSVAAATKNNIWAVVNYHGSDIWIVTPDGVAHAVPPGCRGQTAVWREGDKEVEPPMGAYKWETIPLPHGAGKELLRKEKVTLDKRDYYCRHFTTR